MTWWKWLVVISWTYMIVTLFMQNQPLGAIGWSFAVFLLFANEHLSSIVKQYEGLIENILKKLTPEKSKETK